MVRRFETLVAWVGAAGFALFGVWAMAAPQSFFDTVATFEPYNRHLIQDVGSFQIGLAAVLLVALVARVDALATALLGTGIASAAHTVSHLLGTDLGGNPATDIPTFAVITVALLAAGVSRARRPRP